MRNSSGTHNNNNSNSARSARREHRSQHNDNRNNNNTNDNNNNNTQRNTQYERRKQQTHNQQQQQQQSQPQQQQQQTQQNPPQHQQSYHHQQQQPYHQQHQSQDRRDQSGQRDQSNQRDRSNQRAGQYPDSSMGRDPFGPSGHLGAVKFTPGYPTRELPPIKTKAEPGEKFTGRCRLFVGNLPHNTTEAQVKKLFEPFGEIGEVYLGLKSAYAFVKMDTKQSAEAARDALDCSNFDGRSLRVRLAAHAAAIRVKHLSPVVTNELLAYAFRYFGEIERAVVVVDDKGKSTGEGIVEYSKKQSALFAVKRCQTECFMLTAAPMPVLVEPYDQHDEEEGLPEKSVNRNSIEYKEQRDVGPRFAEQGTFEHSFALKWKELYAIEKQKRERFEQEIEEARKNLQDQIEYSRLEHDTMQLRSKLQQLEDNRLRLQQMKEQRMTVPQQRDEQRRQEDLLIRQHEEDILRRQQLGDPNCLSQQESALRSQQHLLHDMLNGADGTDPNEVNQQNLQHVGLSTELGSSMSANQIVGQAMDMSHHYMQQQQQHIQMSLQGANQLASQTMYAGYIPPPPIQGTVGDAMGNSYGSYQQTYVPPPVTSQPDTGISSGRQQKMTRSFVNSANNINVVGRPKKRGRF